ncbi:MAG: asparagine synthase (glutamine-hydrolyzing) [Chthoniobacterales bacterium]|nr:asparagine synthase (glutamine-hydrolyzing) [Chthoniobacterales bacterium]
MCGIAGIAGRGDGWPDKPGVQLVADLLERQVHRGPDDSGLWEGGDVVLGHRRLAIIDLSAAGHQPMEDPASGCVITFNGEIYNFRELRAELETLGRKFHSHTDTEVLLGAYAEWGSRFVERLDGMFAFVLCDPARRILLMARDHVGIKPLYYARASNGALCWASEVRSLIHSGLVSRTLAPTALTDYLRLGSIQEPHTIFAEVRAFPPGHMAEISVDSLAPFCPRPYWDLESFYRAGGGDPTAHRALLEQTVRGQLVADVPVGIFLSAGLDSSALATITVATREMPDRLAAFTIASGGGDQNEAAWAAAAAALLGLRHHTRILDDPTAGDWIPGGLAAMDQPSCDGMNTYLASRASRESGMVVALAGTGADELHGGYDHFYQLPRLFRLLAHPVLRRLAGPILALARGSLAVRRLRLMADAYPSLPAMVDEKRRYFMPEWIRRHAPVGTGDSGAVAASRCEHLEDAISLAEMSGYLRNTLLRDSDWATMANSQELRVPYLGKRYMEYVATLPWDAKMRRAGVNKPLIAKALTSELRSLLARRPKTGFHLDFVRLISGPLRETFREAIAALRENGFSLSPEHLLSALESTKSQKYARRLWALTALGFYLRHNVGRL